MSASDSVSVRTVLEGERLQCLVFWLTFFLHSNSQTPRASWSAFFPKMSEIDPNVKVSRWPIRFLNCRDWVEISILTQFFFTQQLWKPRSDLVSFLFQTGWQYGRYHQIRYAMSLCISLPSLQRYDLFYLMQSSWRNWLNCEAIPRCS